MIQTALVDRFLEQAQNMPSTCREYSDAAPGSYRTVTETQRDALAAHYRTLGGADRRQRFGGGMSDQAVVAYVLGIDWKWHWVMAYAPARDIVVAVEVVAHPRRGWSHCEFVVSRSTAGIAFQVQVELLQMAIHEARERDCRSMDMSLAWADLLQPLRRDAQPPDEPDTAPEVSIDLNEWFGSGLTVGPAS